MPMKWSTPECSGISDTPQIKNHTATLVGKKLYVFGGYDGRRNHNDMHVLNVTTFTWSKPTVFGKIPNGRNGHTATLIEKRIFVLGGWLGSGPLAASDLHIFDLEFMRWSEPVSTGEAPGPCNMHTSDAIGRSLFVFRGGDGRDYLNHLHILNIDTMHWQKTTAAGDTPPPRANHSSTVVGNKLYIFGGWDGQKRLNDLYFLDTSVMCWSKPEVKGIPPSPRAGMSLTNIRNKLFLFGGSGPSAKCFNDLQIFDPETMTWTCPSDTLAQEDAPDRRAGHSTTVVDRRLFVFGGSYGSTYFKDFHVLDTDPAPPVRMAAKSCEFQLRQGLHAYLNNPDFSDITFLVEGRPLYAHKVILSVLSERLRAMFSSGMKESRCPEIVIPDVRYSVFYCMCHFLYTGEVQFSFEDPSFNAAALSAAAVENVSNTFGKDSGSESSTSLKEDPLVSLEFLLEVLEVADQFMLDHLKQACETHLVERVDHSNVLVLREQADRHQALQLRSYCDWWTRQQEHSAVSPTHSAIPAFNLSLRDDSPTTVN
eukprot:GILJ01003208.1.p1 GENE.GILJ01003208.1~~GILJ01003208.1.p1  ORF type:complete len:537 (+),score=47.89 GILJ01003208.1:88-1698(+)